MNRSVDCCVVGGRMTLTLIASIAYSTWNRRPSGEKVLTPLSYSDRVRNILNRKLNVVVQEVPLNPSRQERESKMELQVTSGQQTITRPVFLRWRFCQKKLTEFELFFDDENFMITQTSSYNNKAKRFRSVSHVY
jgi:hypothetical protein